MQLTKSSVQLQYVLYYRLTPECSGMGIKAVVVAAECIVVVTNL